MRRSLPFRWAGPPRGSVSWVTLFLLAIVGGGAYLAWAWGPAYLRNFQAKQIVREYVNRAVKDRDDAALVRELCDKLRAIDTVMARGEDGQLVEQPAIPVTVDDVTWDADRSGTPPTLHVAIEYAAVVSYPWLERQDRKVFAIDVTEDISVPVWK